MHQWTSIIVHEDDRIEALRPERNLPYRIRIYPEAGQHQLSLQMSQEQLEDLRFQINCVLDDRPEPVEGDCSGCSHAMADHDGDGCTGWTGGVLCTCEVTA